MEGLEDECGILYVGDLNNSVTKKILFEKFKEYGKILSIRVCRNVNTKKSLGYAYVNFKKKSEAKEAIEAMNLANIHGKPCRVMWFDKDPSKRKSGFGNIIIKNIDEFTSVREINEVFSNFGNITSCKLKTDEMGTSTGSAFVNYENEEDAESAIEAMNQNVLGENVITVEKFYIKNTSPKDHLTSCFIDNCPDYFDDDLLRSTFEKYGPVVFAKVMVNDRGVTRGLGFVSFKESEDATQAVRDLDGRMIQNKRIHVYRVIKKKEARNTNLYINNLSSKMNDDLLRTEFEVFGKIVSARVMVDPSTNKSMCYGFVSFANREDANKAIHEMNGRVHLGKKMYVALNKSESQEQPPQPQAAVPSINPFFGYQNIARPPIPPWSLQVPFPLSAPYMWPQSNLMTRLYGPPISQNMSSFPRPASLGPGTVKQMLVERLYPTVFKYAGLRAGPIMAKLMDLDIAELSGMIENNVLLLTKIQKIVEDFSKIVEPIVDLDSKSVSTQNTNDSGIKTAEVESSSSEESSDEYFSGDELSMESKVALGKKILPFVEKTAGGLSTKIMDVLLKLDKTELLYMIANEDCLKLKIEGLRCSLSNPGPHLKEVKDNGGFRRKKTFPGTDLRTPRIVPNRDFVEAKQLLGEKIYPLVAKVGGDLAGKITGMLLELDNVELLYMIENEDSLRLKVEEAMVVLNVYDDKGTLKGAPRYCELGKDDSLSEIP